MRDPKRIPEFLKELQELWELAPDIRFGQLTMIINGLFNDKYNDHFYVEDDEYLQWIKQYKSELKGVLNNE